MRTIVFVLLFFTQISFAQILSEKERALLKDEILEDRFKNLLPGLMEDANIDMWLLISREYNEDPVLKTMLPATWLNARRRTIIVFYRNKKEKIIERLAVARYNIGKSLQSSWDKEKEPSQWKALVDIIASRNPDKIGINFSKHFALADGLVKTDFDELLENLPETYQERLVSAEKLAIGWLETRSKMEMKLYKKLVKITHDIIDEAFSANVIQTGITTTEDIVWFMRQKVTDLGLETWFHPTVDIQRNNELLKSHITSFSKGKEEKIIQKGDLLHCDFGITYIGLNTDCQQHAYVLKKTESEVPAFLKEAFKKGNRVQDILTNNMSLGITGNEILKSSLEYYFYKIFIDIGRFLKNIASINYWGYSFSCLDVEAQAPI